MTLVLNPDGTLAGDGLQVLGGTRTGLTDLAGNEADLSGYSFGGTPLAASTTYNGTYGTSDSPYDPGDMQFLNDQESRVREALGRTGTTLNQGLTSLQDSYDKETGRTNEQRGIAMRDYGIKRQDTQRDKEGRLGQVNTNARTLADSLRRILGIASGSGSSAYRFAAPNAVARKASQERTGVQETYGRNFRNLDLAEQDANTKFDQLLQDLGEQKKQRESSLRAGVLQTEQQLNTDLADIAAEKARLQGGSYSNVRLAQQPYLNAINERQASIDNLFNQFRTPYQTRQVQTQAPELSQYTVDRAAINANNQSGQQDAYSPFISSLRKRFQQV